MADQVDGSDGWHKSTSSDTDQCVEIRFLDELTQVRNSRDPDGPILSFTGPEWLAFLDGVRSGEFDG